MVAARAPLGGQRPNGKESASTVPLGRATRQMANAPFELPLDAPGPAARDSDRALDVDVDLAAFFDRVNHDVPFGKLAHQITDRRVLGLIHRYLEAGVMANGVVVERYEGTPQGGPRRRPWRTCSWTTRIRR